MLSLCLTALAYTGAPRPQRAFARALPAAGLAPRALPRMAAAQEVAEAVASMDEAAIALDDPAAISRPVRGPDGRLQPVLTLPGDTLDDTPLMAAVTAASTALVVGTVARAFALCTTPLCPVLGVALGLVAGELFSGTFHWATDNYGRLETPVVGFACAAFQGHHLAPWTISHRSFTNNVHKIAAASLPLTLACLAMLPPSGAAFFATLFYCQLLAQEFHRWTHTPPRHLALWQRRLQKAGIALPIAEHVAHHRPPFDKHYCILTGGLNELLDSKPLLFWRRLEAIVFRIWGQEPHSWKDPRVKELALRL